VVNAARYFHLTGAKPGRVLVLRKSAAAVLVDSTDRIIELTVLHALPHAFTADERTWYRGLALINDEVLPVVDHNAFLSKAELSGFRTALEESRKAAVV
jgi:chemotaxis signal transduction protein